MKSAPQASPHPLAQVRRSRGWTYQDLARVIADNARAMGVPMAARREKVWRWEHWGVVPEPDSQRALARALGVPLREVDAKPWPGWLPVHDGVPAGLPWTPEGALAALRALLGDGAGAEDLRGYPLLTGRALREAIADWAAAPEPAGQPDGQPDGPRDGVADAGVADAGTADAGTAAWLESGVLGLRRLDDRLGGTAVRHRVEADLRLASELLHRGVPGAAVRARLFAVAADLAQLGGWAAADGGRHAAAQRYFLTGLRAAHSAGSRPLAAHLLAGLSLQSLLAGRPRDALAAADAAALAAEGGGGRLRAMAATRRARALAVLGDAARCRHALDRAGELLAGAGDGADPPWLYWFGAAELSAQAGTALLHLGCAQEAGPLLEAAVRALDPSFTRDRCLYTALAGTARLRTGDLAGARALADEAAGLARHCASPRVTAAVASLRAELEDRGAAGWRGGGEAGRAAVAT
ncbi:hypothetical protein GCM10027168_61350 [Streptomyces capparidis]